MTLRHSGHGSPVNTGIPELARHSIGRETFQAAPPLRVTGSRGEVSSSLPELRAAADLLAKADDLAAKAKADNTRAAYAADWLTFERWCASHGVTALPAAEDTVRAYIADAAQTVSARTGAPYAASTIARRVASINAAHRARGFPPPGDTEAVRATLTGLRRAQGRRTRQMDPLLLDDLRAVLGSLDLYSYPHGVIGRRDAVLLLVGFIGGFRRSELAALNLGDATWRKSDGLHVLVRRSKTDQDGEGLVKAVPFGQQVETCGPCAVARWLAVVRAQQEEGRVGVMRVLARDLAKFDRGGPPQHVCRRWPTRTELGPELVDAPLLRPVHRNGHIGAGHLSGQAIAAVVKRRGRETGLGDLQLAGHSLRAGFATQAMRNGAAPYEVMRQVGWKSEAMVRRYDRNNNPLSRNAVTTLGL